MIRPVYMICMHDMYTWFAYSHFDNLSQVKHQYKYTDICFDSFGPGSAASGRATGGSTEPAVDVLPHISLHQMTFWYHFSPFFSIPNPIFSILKSFLELLNVHVRKIPSRSSWYLYGSATRGRVRIRRLLCFTERRSAEDDAWKSRMLIGYSAFEDTCRYVLMEMLQTLWRQC